MRGSADLILRHADGRPLPLQVRRCDTLGCRLLGLMFRRRLLPGEALLFVEPAESRIATAIHMWFVFFPLGVVWLAADGTVVDKALARPFRPYYVPAHPARYYLEAAPSILEEVSVGERLLIEEVGEAEQEGRPVNV
ncbi:MAG: DUF192 domain-containing protein [Anaerolineae bacterium]